MFPSYNNYILWIYTIPTKLPPLKITYYSNKTIVVSSKWLNINGMPFEIIGDSIECSTGG